MAGATEILTIKERKKVTMRVERSIEIAAPPEKIWPYLVEPEKIMKWCTNLNRFEYTSEQCDGLGAPCYFEIKVPTGIAKCNAKFTEWVENERLTFSMTSGDFKSYEERWTLEATPSGSNANLMMQIEIPYGIIGKILERLFARRTQATAEEIVANLKNLVEAQEANGKRR